jgi:protein arginine kinase
MRASVMLHLPALVMTRQIDKVFQAVSKINLAVRGLYGGRHASLRRLLPVLEPAHAGEERGARSSRMIERMIPKIIEYERAVREQLLEAEKRGHRGQGLARLRHAADRSDDQLEETWTSFSPSGWA